MNPSGVSGQINVCLGAKQLACFVGVSQASSPDRASKPLARQGGLSAIRAFLRQEFTAGSRDPPTPPCVSQPQISHITGRLKS